MEPLEFETVGFSRKFDNRCNSQRIMGRKLGIDDVTQFDQFFGACHIIEVGHRFARKYGVVGKAALLRAFDLGVPISTLYEAHHQAAPMAASLCSHIIDNRLST